MKLHLPSSLRSALLSCLSASFVFTTGSGVLQAGEQELTFNGATLNWTTAPENQVFTAADSSPAAFAPGDNVYFTGTTQVTLGEDIAVGILGVEAGAHVDITPGAYALEAERIELSGTLDYGSALHIGEGQTLAVEGAGSVLDSALVLQDNGAIEVAAVANLNNNSLSMQGGTALSLSTTGDGRVYNLFTGVSSLLDAQGNTLVLNTANNAVSNYFDTTRPGTGFWAGATLQLTTDGTLQLVRHSETVKNALTITTRQTDPEEYSYYTSIAFNDISASGYYGAINGTNINISNNGNVTFSGNGGYVGAICGTNINISNNGNVTFSGNDGGYGSAINGTNINISNNGNVTFDGGLGAAISGNPNGSPITLCYNGSVTFSENSASYGGAIYGNYNKNITLSNNGSVTFSGNSASVRGGAIDGESCTLSNNGSVAFCGNMVSSTNGDAWSGAIFGNTGTIMLSNNNSVTFCGNMVSSTNGNADGGAIFGNPGTTIMLSSNNSVTFCGNMASSTNGNARSGAIYGYTGSTIMLSNNNSVTFCGNMASSTYGNAYGGAIYGYTGSTIMLSNNNSVTFCGNMATSSGYNADGGAIYGDRVSSITLSDNGDVIFCGNSATSDGGAIYGYLDSRITLSNNNSVTFSGNTAQDGGAIYTQNLEAFITLSNNGSVTFRENTADSGGAINGSKITLSNNDNVTFSENSASVRGGAIEGSITMSNNGSVTFRENTANSGGAINGSKITLSNNNNVTFSGNDGGSGSAIHGESVTLSDNGDVTFAGNNASSVKPYTTVSGAINGGTITLSDNGDVTFVGNNASSVGTYARAYGGAIYGDQISIITLSDNGDVTFCGNSVSAFEGAFAIGGAISTYGNLSIRNNDSVLFEKNAEISDDTYRLRSIYDGYRIYPPDSPCHNISFSTAEGKAIEFRDSVYIDSGSTVELNADYTDSEGNVIKQEGDIIFTGAYTETHLNELLTADGAGRTATAEEIANSRTSEMHGKVTLYGGTMRVEEQAVLKTTAGLDVAAGSNATVKVSNAELDAGSSDINVGDSGTLTLMNGATVKAVNINIADGASFEGRTSSSQEAVATFSLREAASVAEPPQSCLVDANLTLEAGSTLVADGVYFSMTEGSTLTFKALTGGDKINLVLTLGAEYSDNEQVVLFSDVDVARFILDGVELSTTDSLLANTFFTGAWVNDKTTLSYDSSSGTISLQHLNTVTIPEPTTATLSLLALAALAARRRRR